MNIYKNLKPKINSFLKGCTCHKEKNLNIIPILSIITPRKNRLFLFVLMLQFLENPLYTLAQ